MKEKVKYNIEKELILNNWVVDPINQATFQEPIYVDGYSEVINIDLSKSNYFIIDLEDEYHSIERRVSLNPINHKGIQRFEVLFIEPFGVRYFDFNENMFHLAPIFYDSFFDELFQMVKGQRRLMLLSFKRHYQDGSIMFIGDISPWTETSILNVMIVFYVNDQYNEPVSGVMISLGIIGHTLSIRRTHNGVCVFSVPRGYDYIYVGTYGVISTVVFTGSISSSASNIRTLTIEKTI